MLEEYHDALADLLERCTVKISHRDQVGTGFFVAPGLVLTCAHVLRERSATRQKVHFRWNESDEEGSLETLLPTPCPEDGIFPDLALISHHITNTPCVLLEPGYKDGDALYSWGYSNAASAGESLSATCEGKRKYAETVERQLIKFKGTQVLPGISGSPLLNRRTGAVCGIIKRTRDEESDLGGLAIRTQLLLELLPDISMQNRLFHEASPLWRDALGGLLTAERFDSERRNRGPKFVNRETQEAEFKTFWMDAAFCRPRAAQVYLLPSLEDDCPDLFTDRLRGDAVERLARSFKGPKKAAVHHVVVSEEPRYQSLETMQRDLSQGLFEEFEALPLLNRSELLAKPLSKLERLRLPTFVLIEQFVRADSAAAHLITFLRWYFSSFWAGFYSDANVIVFVHLVCSAAKEYDSWFRTVLQWGRRAPSPYADLDAMLKTVLPAGEANLALESTGAPVKRLSPLAPIQADDIRRWLRRLGMSQEDIARTMKSRFKDLRRKRGTEVRYGQVHKRLDDLYTQHLSAKSLELRRP